MNAECWWIKWLIWNDKKKLLIFYPPIFSDKRKAEKSIRVEINVSIIQSNSKIFQVISLIRVELRGKFNVTFFFLLPFFSLRLKERRKKKRGKQQVTFDISGFNVFLIPRVGESILKWKQELDIFFDTFFN